MEAHRQALAFAIAAATIALGTVPVLAQQATSSPERAQQLASANRKADTDASRHLNSAISHMSAGKPRQARDRLERAETALLNRQALDLGAELKPNEPVPQTAALDQIVKARQALAARNVPQARQLARSANQDISSEVAAVPER